MADNALKNHPVTRIAHYLFLLPFFPALRPLLVDFRLKDMIIYAAGMALVLFLIIYSNQRPLVRIEANRLCLYLHYRHNAEFHPYSEMTGYRRMTGNRIIIRSEGHHPVVLRLKGRDIDTLIKQLEDKEIHALEI